MNKILKSRRNDCREGRDLSEDVGHGEAGRVGTVVVPDNADDEDDIEVIHADDNNNTCQARVESYIGK